MRHHRFPSRSALAVVITGLLCASLLAVAPVSAVAQTNSTTTVTETPTATPETCQGNPQMSSTSIAIPDSTITADEGATVEANFRSEPTLPEDCTIVVDLEFSFAQTGFQFGGGGNWEQSTTNLVATQFEVSPGEIRDIRAHVYTNGAEPGDEVTVTADYEIWYKGDRENSRQQSGIRRSVSVEAVNTPTESNGEADQGDQTAAEDPTPTEPSPIVELIDENLGLLSVFVLGLVSTVGLIYREPIVNIVTGGN